MKLIYLDDHAYSKFIQFDVTTNQKTKLKFLKDHGIKYDIVDEKDLPICHRYASDGQAKDPEETDFFINNNTSNLVDDAPFNEDLKFDFQGGENINTLENADDYDEVQDNSSEEKEEIEDSKSMKMMLDSFLKLCQ